MINTMSKLAAAGVIGAITLTAAAPAQSALICGAERADLPMGGCRRSA